MICLLRLSLSGKHCNNYYKLMIITEKLTIELKNHEMGGGQY